MQRLAGRAYARLLSSALAPTIAAASKNAVAGTWRAVASECTSKELRTAAPAPAPLSTFAAASSAARLLHGCAAAAAPSAEDAASSSKGGDDFHHKADLLIGDMWNRLERGLRSAEGEQFDFEVKTEHGGLTVQLPGGGWVRIHKEPEERALRVQNTLFPAHENKSEVVFKMDEGGTKWAEPEDNEDIYSFLEEGLSTELKVKIDLRGG